MKQTGRLIQKLFISIYHRPFHPVKEQSINDEDLSGSERGRFKKNQVDTEESFSMVYVINGLHCMSETVEMLFFFFGGGWNCGRGR